MKWFKPFSFPRGRNQAIWASDDLKERAPMLPERNLEENIQKRRSTCLSRCVLAWLPHVFLIAMYTAILLTWPMFRPSEILSSKMHTLDEYLTA